MSEMVERVATRLRAEFQRGTPLGRNEAEILARAAIEAMCDPTVDMLIKRRDYLIPMSFNRQSAPGFELHGKAALHFWHGMIDDALGK